MSTPSDGLHTFQAGTDLSAKQHYIVKEHSTANQVAIAAAATDKPVGTLAVPPAAANDPCGVRVGGRGKVILGGTVVLGDLLASDSAGKAVATTSAGDYTIGKALQGGVAGAVIEYHAAPALI